MLSIEKVLNDLRVTFVKYCKIISYKKAAVYIYHEPKLNTEISDEMASFNQSPLMSVIMPVNKMEREWLEKAITSVERQWYDNWQLIIIYDVSNAPEIIKYLHSINSSKIKTLANDKNISKASNEALAIAEGSYIVFLDQNDELTPDALYEVVKVINKTGSEFIYSDEDKLGMDGTFCEPNFKPDYSPELFLSTNYISYLGVIKKNLINKVGGFSIGLNGTQYYDLYLKVLEHIDKTHHIQKVLYHRRKITNSTASLFEVESSENEAGKRALQFALARREIKAKVVFGHLAGLYRIQYELHSQPLISIIIPFKDKAELLKTCLKSILDKTTYKNYEVIGISNNSKKKATFHEMKRLEQLDYRIKFYEYNVPFNYSKINNYAVKKYAKGEHVIFLNNDIEILTPRWIEELLMFSQQEEIGAVGCKLYYPDDTIQHAGLVIAPNTPHSVINVFRKSKRSSPRGDNNIRLSVVNNYLAVTAACLMLERKKFLNVGGFDEENLKIAYNDVDLCLSLVEQGYRNVYTPYCEAYHYESASRGAADSIEKKEHTKKEQYRLKLKHKEVFRCVDPYFNRNLDCYSEHFSVSKENTVARSLFYSCRKAINML